MSYQIKGDFVVCGLVTGTHVIEDISVPVPYQVAVRIPADLAHRSKDLWRGIQQRRLFLLTSGSGLSISNSDPPVPEERPSTSEPVSVSVQQLDQFRKENETLKGLLNTQTEKLEAILTAINRLGTGSIVEGVQTAIKAVGGATPLFVPSDELKPKSAETNIQVSEKTLDGDLVVDAAAKLKSLRKKSTD